MRIIPLRSQLFQILKPQLLTLNQIFSASFDFSAVPSVNDPLVFNIPSSPNTLNLSVTLCTSQLPALRFVLSNDTTNTNGRLPKPGEGSNSQNNGDEEDKKGSKDDDSGKGPIWDVNLVEGLGTWEGSAANGGLLAVYMGDGAQRGQNWKFEIGLSDGGEYFWIILSS